VVFKERKFATQYVPLLVPLLEKVLQDALVVAQNNNKIL
tara:strand:+ start:135 stop:251 length:117 start_codon:yes stop_codon:yes gene_type:complete